MSIRELIKSFTKQDYADNLVNLHLHTNYSDGQADFENLINQAKKKGYEKIAISDHNTLQGYFDNNITQENILIPAVEFDVWCGYVFMHLLAYGIDINSEELKPFLAKSKHETEVDVLRLFTKRNIKKLIKSIHNAGGIAVLAHPACCWALNMEHFIEKLISYGLDGLEVYYPYKRHRGIIKFHRASCIERLAEKYNLLKTGGTDLHTTELP